jgi:hypothetical protein
MTMESRSSDRREMVVEKQERDNPCYFNSCSCALVFADLGVSGATLLDLFSIFARP